jgi:serine/threonine protein kinase
LTVVLAPLADRYRIERHLGTGGMATVYLAHDVRHDRKVAIKVLKPELAAVLGADRFVVEIKTTASLQYPHLLPLFDSGTVASPEPYVADPPQGRFREGTSFLYYVMP